MSRKNGQKKVALLIDAANCRNVDFEQVIRIAGRHGELVVAQAYGNFANSRDLSGPAQTLFLLGVRLIHCPAWPSGPGEWKSAADELLMNDVRTLLQTRRGLTRFIICSGDGHYVPTMCEIKRRGKEVIVMANQQTTSRWVEEVADKFIPLPPAATPVPKEVFQALVRAISSLQRAQNRSAVPSGNVKQKMIELLSEFDEKKYRGRRGRPFQNFTEFLKEAQSQGWVRVIRQDGVLLVTTTSERSQAA